MQGWDFGMVGAGAIGVVLLLARRLRETPLRFLLAMAAWMGPNWVLIAALEALGTLARGTKALTPQEMALVVAGMGLSFFFAGVASIRLALWTVGSLGGSGCVALYGLFFGVAGLILTVVCSVQIEPDTRAFLGLVVLWPAGQLLGTRGRPSPKA